MIAVVGGPVELVAAVAFVNGVLRLVSGSVDECKRLAHGRLPSKCRTFPNYLLPGLRSGKGTREPAKAAVVNTLRKTREETSRDANKFRPEGSITVWRGKVRRESKFAAGILRGDGGAGPGLDKQAGLNYLRS